MHQDAAALHCQRNGSSMWKRWDRLDTQDVTRTKPGKTWLEHPRSSALRLLRRLIHVQVCTRRRPRCCITAPAPRCGHTATEVPRQWVAAHWWIPRWGDLGGVTLQGLGNIPSLAKVGKRHWQHCTSPGAGNSEWHAEQCQVET